MFRTSLNVDGRLSAQLDITLASDTYKIKANQDQDKCLEKQLVFWGENNNTAGLMIEANLF